MPLDRDLLDAVKELDDHDLRRLLILAQARLESSGILQAGRRSSVSLRQKWVSCGKSNCSQCPHGPYWYAYWHENGRRRSRYVGKLLDTDEPGADATSQ